MTSQSEVTCLLREAGQGNKEALDRLMPLVYEELRARAGAFLRCERPDHTLQTTALVHEAYLRLIDQKQVTWADRVHFFAMASTCIRRILVDHARRKQAVKRARNLTDTPVEDVGAAVQDSQRDLLALDEAMSGLAGMDPRKARVVELRFFGGLQNTEVAQVLQISESTVERDFRLARAWLHRALSGEASP